MLWYLGDGSITNGDGTVMLRLSTDGFVVDDVEMLSDRLCNMGIKCHRNGDNRIQIEARGIPEFFKFIGRESPVECYSYKFNIPGWRFESKRMMEVANELGCDHGRLSHLVKTGRLTVFRDGKNSKPRFLKEHIEAAKNAIDRGDLY